MNVLLVQEKSFLSSALQADLASKGYRLIFSNNFADTETAITNVGPVVLIIDISGNTGISYIGEAVRSNIPVIVITKNGNEEVLQQAFDLGAADYVCQPVSVKELSLRVSILARAKVRSAASIF